MSAPLAPPADRSSSLSWERAPVRELLRLSWPITVSTLSYSVMTLVDTLLVGRLGSAALAGVGLAGTAAFVLLCFSFGLLRGVKTLVAQAVGADRPGEVDAYLGASVIAGLVSGVATLIVGQGLAPLLPLLAATPAAGAAAASYLRIRALGAPMAVLYVALREVRYGESEARAPMRATVVANLVNLALAWTFVYRLGWGVRGAAVATVIAHAIEAGLLARGEVRRRFGLGAVTREHLAALWRVGLPTAVQFTLEVGAFAMLTGMVSRLSETQMAAHQIALQVIHFSFLPAFAIAEGASVLAGQAVGAGKDALVVRVARLALGAAALYTGACATIMAGGAPLLVRGFTDVGSLAEAAIRLLHVAAVFQVFDGANIVARATLRGTGDVRFPALVGVISSWALTPPLTWLLGYRLGLGAFGGWIGLSAEIILAAALLWWRLERGGWHAAARAARAEILAAAGTPVARA